MAIYRIIDMEVDKKDGSDVKFVFSQDPLTEEEKSHFLSTLCRVKDTYKHKGWNTTDFIEAAIVRFNAVATCRSHILHSHTNPINDTFMF